MLDIPFTIEKIQINLFNMAAMKCPGPVDIQPLFPKILESVRESLSRLLLDFFSTGCSPMGSMTHSFL